MSHHHSPIILFDGICNLCNSSVQFIIKRDAKAIFKFAPLQSLAALDLLEKYQLDKTPLDSIIYLKEEVLYSKSTAALLICKHLNGLWPLLYAFIIIPRPLRDRIYQWIAKNRYRWFGKRKECMIPDDGILKRFLDEPL